jgi:signal transduction histidine kinase/CheY-like chemotaxis protein
MSWWSNRPQGHPRQGLVEYFFVAGSLSVVAFAVLFHLLGLRAASLVEATYLVVALSSLAWVVLTGRHVRAMVRLHIGLVLGVSFGITLLLGGLAPAGGFTMWGIISPLAAMVFLSWREAVAVSALFLLGVVWLAWLGPLSPGAPSLEPRIFAWYVATNLVGVTAFVLVTAAYTLLMLNRERRQREASQAEALKAQKLESLGTLAGGIAHDFNNLLTGFIGNLDLARESAHAGDLVDVDDLLGRARRSVERARGLTGQLLAFARGGAPVRATAAIRETVAESSAFVLRGSNVTARMELAEDLWPVDADVGQISQLVQNLVLNAAQAMPAGGEVVVRASNLAAGARGHGLDPEKRHVCLEVEDHGCGIPEADRAKVFDPYFTTRTGGTGLGLTMCHTIVRGHGGSMGFDSRVGRGTTFRVYLPASERPMVAEPARAPVPDVRPGRVLLMDDEVDVLHVLARMLRSLGHQVETAAEGGAAVELYRRARQEGRPFDLAIFDLTVKGGMGGEEAVRAVLQDDPVARVLASSGYANNRVMADHRAYGFCGVLRKPYGVEELRRALAEVLGAGSDGAGPAGAEVGGGVQGGQGPAAAGPAAPPSVFP